MNKIFSLLFLIPSLASAITIDESGQSRVRKPSITISHEVEDSRLIRRSLVDLINEASQNPSAVIIIEADIDGDGELESYKTSPSQADVSGSGISGWVTGRKESGGQAREVRECCLGMATGKRQHGLSINLDQGQISLEGADGALKLNVVHEESRSRRNQISADYLEFSFVQYNPKEIILDRARKGWDGVVKGGSKRNATISVSLQSQDGKILKNVLLKSKGSGKTEVCGSNNLCGKTDHL